MIGESSNSSQSLEKYLEKLTDAQRKALASKIASNPSSATAEEAMDAAGGVPEPSFSELRLVAINNSIPFVGFGVMDNAILIIAGDAIDTSLGVLLGISTMCAAAIGNIISDVAGIMLGTLIEDMATLLNVPVPNLTSAQRQLRSVRFANQFGCAVGIVIGCIIGMFPLLYIDSNRSSVMKREAHLDAIFQDVVSEAGSLVQAARIFLFVTVDPPESEGLPPIPSPNGKFLYAKYREDSPNNTDSETEDESSDSSSSSAFVPLGRGIISRAAMTGEVWKIDDAPSEPDFAPDIDPHARTMVCVPVTDGQGQTIGVLQAVNKIAGEQSSGEGDVNPMWMIGDQGSVLPSDKAPHEGMPVARTKANRLDRPTPFSEQDVQILSALASHIGVAMQKLYEDEEAEHELRLRDTIRIMKQYGPAGLKDGSARAQQPDSSLPALFPET